MKNIITCILIVLVIHSTNGQDPLRFRAEVDTLLKHLDPTGNEEPIVFTGSSSIRIWRDIDDDFPNHPVINTGFGGSQMADLVYYFDDLIASQRPSKVFIYEGDNDISTGKTTSEILNDAERLLQLIRTNISENIPVYFISAKPSPSRWHLKSGFEDFNNALRLWCNQNDNVTYVDVWTPMIGTDGTVYKHIFQADSLHMNTDGYELWKEVIQDYVR